MYNYCLHFINKETEDLEVEELGQGHTLKNSCSWDLNLGSWVSESMLLPLHIVASPEA